MRAGFCVLAGRQGDGGEVDRSVEECARLRVRVEEILDLGAQTGIPGTRPVEEGASAVRRQVQRLLQERGEAPPAIGRRERSHVADAPDSARYRRARAARQSRFTVRESSPRTSAVSSIDSPAKKRSSTIFTIRSLRAASCPSA